MHISELFKIYQQFPSIQTDTRRLKPGDLFFALKGNNFNGNLFAKQALEAGATYAIIDEKDQIDTGTDQSGKTILVDDVLTTLQELAAYHRAQFKIPFLAITGSNGKTTTKELIHAVLSTSYKTFTTQGNLNNHIGVPLTILKIREDAEIAVIEMGANHTGEIASYCRIALPTHGIITNCGKAHLEGFGGTEGVKKGKGELYDHLRNNKGTAFVMWDYDYLQLMSKGIQEIISYGTSNASVEGEIVSCDPLLEISIKKTRELVLLKTHLPGEYNFPNLLAAVTVGKYFKVPDEKIKKAIEHYIPSDNRSQMIRKGSNIIFLDAYNANPSSMIAAIQNFAKLKNENKVLLLGAMAELGEDSLNEHQSIIDLVKKYTWNDVVLVGGDFMKIDHPFLEFETAAQAKNWFVKQDFQETCFLIKGSRSIRMEEILD